MSIERRHRRRKDGKRYMVWRVRWYAGGRERSRTFARARDAQAFEAKVRALKRKSHDGFARSIDARRRYSQRPS